MSKAWKCVKHTSNDRNRLQLSKHDNPQSLVLIGVQTCAKMPKEHFIKNSACIQLPYMRKKNAWTYENMPQIHVKMPQGANTKNINTNGTKPNQQNLKFLQDIKFSQPNTNKPQP